MRAYFQKRQEELYNAYKTSSALGHSVPKGNERELIASQFLTQHMPSFVQVSEGILIDQNTVDFKLLSQTTSPQIDLLLAISSFPQLTLYGGSRIFFAESVAAVIEVKTELTLSEIEKILNHCEKVKKRRRQIFGFFNAIPGDVTSRPSETVPYYVVAFDSGKNAQEIMELIKKKSLEAGLSDAEQLVCHPDGIFILNPESGTVVLKEIGLHNLAINNKISPFCGGEIKTDSLLGLWFTLMGQVEAIRCLNFPLKNYAHNIFPKPS